MDTSRTTLRERLARRATASSRLLALGGALALALLPVLGVRPAAAFVVSGTVTDARGAVVADVDFDADDLVHGGRVTTPHDNSNRHGVYTVDLPAGLYRISFTPPGGLPLAALVLPRVEVTGDTELSVELADGVALGGRVTDPRGAGVAEVDLDVNVAATHTRVPTPGDTTNSLGFYSVFVPSGTYDLVYQPPVATRLAPVRMDGVSITGDTVVPVVLQDGVALSGAVTVRGADPVAGIDLDLTDTATGNGVPLAGDKTAADGSYTIIVVPGVYDVVFDAPPATRLVSRRVPAVDLSGGDTELAAELVSGFLCSGTVRDSTGRVLEDVDLDFLRQPDGEEIVTPADFTNPAGQFTVVLAGGTYDVVANPPPGSPLLPDTTRAVAVAGDTVVDVVFGAEPPPPPPPPAPPAAQALLPVFPNPASGGATVPLVVDPARGLVRISIYDGQGRLVRVLEHDPGGAGQLAVRWDGRRSSGVAAASGVYFVRARQGSWEGTRKLLLLRAGR